MARWIDASPAQRWNQYQKPADKKTVAEAAEMDALWSRELGRLWQQRRAATDHRARKACTRRVRTEIKLWRNHRAAVIAARARLDCFG